MNRLRGKVALVSGVGSGMGEQHARSLVAAGARVFGFDVVPGSAARLTEELGAESFRWSLGSVCSREDWRRVVAECESAFGAITVLVNNAGIARENRVDSATEEDYRIVVDVNQIGPFLGMQSVIPSMRAAGGGSIINISSTAGQVGMADNFAYSATKWAVRGMTKAAALELVADRIRVNAIFPGEVDTPLLRNDPTAIPPEQSRYGRWARPAEVSACVIFLASDEADYMSGAEMVIDGTYTAG